MHAANQVTLDQKVAYLSRAESFPDRPTEVESVETHFAWVFLSRDYVYKLKKPIRFHSVDFTHLGTRRAICELEITLNKRLAEAVYIGVVPLVLRDAELALTGTGEVVDWLIKMYRLPRERMLDAAVANHTVTPAQLDALIDKLARFYRRASRAPWNAREYVRELERRLEDYRVQLAAPALGLELAKIARIVAAQHQFVRHRTAALERRATLGHIVDAHGDLRPEHVFLADNPQIIDCLEFSTELRWLDTAEEISFLALECERLGDQELGARLLELYVEACDDPGARELFGYYRSQRALVRALLSAWHVPSANDRQSSEHWLERAKWYLDVAESSVRGAA